VCKGCTAPESTMLSPASSGFVSADIKCAYRHGTAPNDAPPPADNDCSLDPEPKLTGNVCWGKNSLHAAAGAQNCSVGVCKACCNQKLDQTECDMCVQRVCQIPDRGLSKCHTC
jgi:hypothetical protein